MPEAIAQWWRRHKWGAWLVYGVTIALAVVGATWLLFLFYIISFGLLLYVLTSFAKHGLGNRPVIAQSCLLGLSLLAQVAGLSWNRWPGHSLCRSDSDWSCLLWRRVGSDALQHTVARNLPASRVLRLQQMGPHWVCSPSWWFPSRRGS